MKHSILGVRFDDLTIDGAVNTLNGYLLSQKNHMVFTPNPELVMAAQSDRFYMDILNSGSLVVPDGIGIVIAAKLKGLPIKERVAGCDLFQIFFAQVKTPITLYLLGAKEGVCAAAKENLEKRYKNVSVIGFHNGYFDKEEEKLITEEIRAKKPDVLLVGLGFPKQEQFIYAHKDLPVRISAGIGGSLDVYAGAVNRAPVFFQKAGLEWLYRVGKQPARIKRLGALPAFLVKAALPAKKENKVESRGKNDKQKNC